MTSLIEIQLDVLLARDALFGDGGIDPLAVVLGGGAFVALVWGRVGPVPLLLAGAAAGLVSRTLLS